VFESRVVTLNERPSVFIRGKPVVSSGRMLRKDYDRKGSVAKRKSLVVSLKGFGAKN
jgi:hypothetical protein